MELLSNVPCFSTLTSSELEELVALMEDVKKTANEKIVNENDIVDSVYIIVSGQAEVSQSETIKTKIIHKTKIISIPIATLHPGETIGLNDIGFFSATGIRTATVTALTDMHLLKLELKKLHDFLERHPHLQQKMLNQSTQFLKMNLIKQSLPFSRLSPERIEWLADKVETLSVPAGKIIFKQGEIGEFSYLIYSGKIEIIGIAEDGMTQHQLAVLKPPTLFGEATLITHSPRNATARALENSELFVIRHEYLSELFESENNIANTFMTLMVDRSRPLKNPSVTLHERTTPDHQEIIVLKNSENGNYFKLSPEGYFIWEQLNGERTMQEITMALADQFNIFAPNIVAGLISKLAKAEFVFHVDIQDTQLKKQSKLSRVVNQIRGLLEKRIAIGDADKWLSIFYQKFGYLFFTVVGKIIFAILVAYGFFSFLTSTPYIVQLFNTLPNSWILLLIAIPLATGEVIFHEMGHALATKAYGHEVHYIGVGWYWLGPVAFTDTSDMWLSARGPRIVVNLAGVYTDSFIAGVCSLFLFIFQSAYAQAFLWLFSLLIYINAFRMLSPLQEWDGYYVLMDLLEKPHLRQNAVIWLVKDFPKSLRHPSLFKNNLPEIMYWLACILFLICVTGIVFLVQEFIFKILHLQSPNIFITLTLPILVLIFSSVSVLMEIKSKAEE
jgi:CRP-like cAMP-binding protein/Zn-dependent protease